MNFNYSCNKDRKEFNLELNILLVVSLTVAFLSVCFLGGSYYFF